jgi:hypothetical protein
MEAICKADYDGRVKARAEMQETLEKMRKSGKPIDGIVIPYVGFYDLYGVWFSGKLIETIRQVGRKQFKVELGDMMHVYMNVDPEKIECGVHNIDVYGHACRLYKWLAQGYYRGLVVLVDDMPGNARAEMFRQSGTWSWVI